MNLAPAWSALGIAPVHSDFSAALASRCCESPGLSVTFPALSALRCSPRPLRTGAEDGVTSGFASAWRGASRMSGPSLLLWMLGPSLLHGAAVSLSLVSFVAQTLEDVFGLLSPVLSWATQSSGVVNSLDAGSAPGCCATWSCHLKSPDLRFIWDVGIVTVPAAQVAVSPESVLMKHSAQPGPLLSTKPPQVWASSLLARVQGLRAWAGSLAQISPWLCLWVAV